MNWRIAFSIARKDIVDSIKNLYILTAILLPVGLSLLFRLAFSGFSTTDLTVMKIVIYDPGHSRLTAAIQAEPDIQVVPVDSELNMEAAVQDATGGLIIPEGFDAAVSAGQKPELRVLVNNKRGGGELAVFRELVERQVWALKGDPFQAQIQWSNANAAGGLTERFANFNMNSFTFIMLLELGIVMIGIFVVPYLLVEEKEKHTLDALLVSPAGAPEIAAGKALAGLFYCVVISGILIALSVGWSGNFHITLLASLLGSLLVVALGLLLGGLLQNMHQVNTWSSIIMLVLVLPSWVTSFMNQSSFDLFIRVFPTYYMTKALEASLAGKATLANTGLNLAVLLACAAAAFGALIWSIRRERLA